MVVYYILLRLKQLLRFFTFNGLHPLAGIPIAMALFLLVSAGIYYKAPYAEWVYLLVAVLTITESQNAKTNRFLHFEVHPALLFKIKLAENFVVLFPFAAVMIYHGNWLQVIISLPLVAGYSRFNQKLPRLKLKLPRSPYPKYSYEANFGYRSLFAAYPLCLVLLIAAGFSGNVYILLVPFIILLFCVQAAYGEPESIIYIWQYRMSSALFLRQKAYLAVRNYSITFFPFLITGLACYPQQWQIIISCFIAGVLVITGSMIIKYQFLESRLVMQITQVIFFGAVVGGLIIPAILIVAILFMLYSTFRARANLLTILKC